MTRLRQYLKIELIGFADGWVGGEREKGIQNGSGSFSLEWVYHLWRWGKLGRWWFGEGRKKELWFRHVKFEIPFFFFSFLLGKSHL